MSDTVIKLPTAKASRPAKRKPSASPRTKPAVPARATIWQTRQGYAFGALATGLLAMSLSHQAHGIETVTGVGAFEGWTMASVIDVGFLLTELMPFTVRIETVRDTKLARLGFSACVYAASAWFNTMAFAHGSPVTIASAAMGVAVPGAIATLIYFAGRCILGRSK